MVYTIVRVRDDYKLDLFELFDKYTCRLFSDYYIIGRGQGPRGVHKQFLKDHGDEL